MPRVVLSAVLLAALTIAVAGAQAPEAFDVVLVKSMRPASGEALARFGNGCDGTFPAWKAGGLLSPPPPTR